MPECIGWTRDQQLIALRLYVGTTFGRLDGWNPAIVALAGRIGRSANALAMSVQLREPGPGVSADRPRGAGGGKHGRPGTVGGVGLPAVGVPELEAPAGPSERERLVRGQAGAGLLPGGGAGQL